MFVIFAVCRLAICWHTIDRAYTENVKMTRVFFSQRESGNKTSSWYVVLRGVNSMTPYQCSHLAALGDEEEDPAAKVRYHHIQLCPFYPHQSLQEEQSLLNSV